MTELELTRQRANDLINQLVGNESVEFRAGYLKAIIVTLSIENCGVLDTLQYLADYKMEQTK